MEGTLSHSSMFDASSLLDEPTLPSLHPLERDAILLRQVELQVPFGKKGIVRSDYLVWCDNAVCILGDISNVGTTSLLCQRTGQSCGLLESDPDTGNLSISSV